MYTNQGAQQFEGGHQHGGHHNNAMHAAGEGMAGAYHKPAGPRPNNILIYTILNQKYVITIEAIHKISARFGQVHRIVMIRRKGTQAMVEFDDVGTARRAMDGLQNQDIYSGCCTLRVEFSKAQKLNVRINDSNSWDFTVQPQLTVDATRQPLITGQPTPMRNNDYGGDAGHNGGGNNNFGGHGGPGMRNSGGYGGPPSHNNFHHGSHQGSQMDMRGGRDSGRTPVAIVYGLTERVNCKHIFNIMCLHGNINKIKFMKSKPGCCMVEFADSEAVSRASRMTGVELFGEKLTVRPSKSMFIGEPKGDTYTLPDNTAGFEEFANSKFNRFSNAASAQKNRIQEPRATVHFFNCPPDIQDDQIRKIFEDEQDEPVHLAGMVIFAKKNDQQKSCAGLAEFEDVSQAMTALALYNHWSIESAESNYPFSMKLCFATQELSQSNKNKKEFNA